MDCPMPSGISTTPKVSDHYAIVPTGQSPPVNFGGDHAKLYDLIVRNFLASWHPIAEWTVIKRVTTKSGHQFVKEVEQLATAGWRAVVPKKDKVPEGWGQLPSNPCDTSLSDHEFSEEKSKPKPTQGSKSPAVDGARWQAHRGR